MNILLPYPNNFKKCARTLSDEQLQMQILDIDTIRKLSFEESDHKELIVRWYSDQIKWLCRYQLALTKEYYKRNKIHHVLYNVYARTYRRIMKHGGLGELYRHRKWQPAAFNENQSIIAVNKKDIGYYYKDYLGINQ